MQAQAFHFSEKPFKKNESRRIVISTREELSARLADTLQKDGWNPGEADVATILTLPIFDEHDAFNIGVEPEYGGKRVCLTIVNKKVFAKFSPVPIIQTENERLAELVLRHEDSHCLSKRGDGDETAGILSESKSDSEAILEKVKEYGAFKFSS